MHLRKSLNQSRQTATLLATTTRSLKCLELSTGLTYCWIVALTSAEQKSGISRIYLTHVLQICSIIAGFRTVQKTAFLHSSGVKVVGLILGMSLAVSDIWVGWSDSVVYRNTPQPERLPLCPSRLCRTRILTQFLHGSFLKLSLQLTGSPAFTSFSFPVQCIYLYF